ncbi:CPBP family intramembrane metalloprotease, partial [Bifidobacterium pullorum subsp. saeculare]
GGAHASAAPAPAITLTYGGGRMRPAWFAVFAGLILAVQAVVLLVQEGFAAAGIDLATPAGDALDASMGSLSMVLYADLVGPVVEEVVFRGLLMHGLRPLGRVFAIVTSAAMFGLYHDDLVQGLFAFGAGLMLGFVAMEYSLFWAIALHVCNNALLSDALGRLIAPFGATGETVGGWVVVAVGLAALVVVLVRYGSGLRAYVRAHRAAPGTHWAWTNGWFLAYVIVNAALTAGSFALAMTA